MAYEVIVLEPAADFLSALDAKFRAKALRTIDLLEELGPRLPMPHARKLAGHELHELRVRLGSNICRLFYFHHRESIYVVTSGYVKKSDKTNVREIVRAVRLKDQYQREELR